MNDPQSIWRLGRWIAARRSGDLHLAWGGGELTLQISLGRAIGIEGPDPTVVARRLGCRPAGHADLLEEAKAAAVQAGRSETDALAIVKSVLERALHSWLLDPDRTLEAAEYEVEEDDRPTISLSHAIVEAVLSDDGDDITSAILPNLNVLLRRTAGFLESYAALQLAEEADLVVAKVTGQRTAEEIASRSPHDPSEVARLLAGLAAAGLLEAVPVAEVSEPVVSVAPVPLEDVGRPAGRRRAWLIAAAVVALVIAVAAVALVLGHNRRQAAVKGHWGIVVDSGCDPQDLQRILRKAGQHPEDLTAQRRDLKGGVPCWQLLWGDYGSSEAARDAIGSVPKALVQEGVTPAVVELTRHTPTGPSGDEGG
ncbi:MAG: hypothetical protein LJE95_01830 [Acidobacteria bacterium]|jgi:hypothetical protein|nr:hypothetical protein [Acidobacteriota bacterium]